ncbi:uncharacterized protein LTHEOB_7059 [Lasiodiplodia theobromae]|uniref:uncharacterized protein n=1 Tax=Lasiodiplodia theobromae TaxID=45133 RepID=UPI0015C3BD5B|nr:uncharacterized protein LTHEOB_7059 [Lasiodiplodia theobromae]KAF4542805.1 hypothetical protein LTHEOB_7059 [Lasiodiplodia theobromae]
MSSSTTTTTRTTFLTTLLALIFISQIVLQLVAADPVPVPAPEAAPAPAPEPEPKKGGSAGAAAAGNRSAGTSIMLSPEDGAVMMMTAVGTSVFTFLVSQLL